MVVFSAAVFGAIAGSFLNALLFRYNTGRSVLRGRSGCMHCGHTLGVLDLVPVLSYLLLRGRCRYCSSRISVQYPAVEVMVGSIAVFLALNTPDLPSFFFWLLVWIILLFVLVYDLRHKIIPLSCSALLAGLGLLLGLTAGLTAFMLAFWSGAVVGIVLLCLPRGYTMKSEVPFAPFLIFGAACAYFLHVDLFYTLPTLFF